jgi:hypothetical protein
LLVPAIPTDYFCGFLSDLDITHDAFSFREHLLDYVYLWLAYGQAVTRCANDYGIFMGAVLLLANHWQRHPGWILSQLSLQNRDAEKVATEPTAILDTSCDMCRDVFDLQLFKFLAHDPEYLLRDFDPDGPSIFLQARTIVAPPGTIL